MTYAVGCLSLGTLYTRWMHTCNNSAVIIGVCAHKLIVNTLLSERDLPIGTLIQNNYLSTNLVYDTTNSCFCGCYLKH